MILYILACDAPPPLDRVSEALAADAAAEAAPAVGFFVSTAAVVAEPCALDSVEGYLWKGQAARALGLTTADITLDEASGEKTWSFGMVTLGLPSEEQVSGSLSIVLSETREQARVSVSGDAMAFTADLDVTLCRADADDSYAGRVLISGEGHYTRDDLTATVSFDGLPPDKALEWAPSNAMVPTSGWVEWTAPDEQTLFVLDSAENIDQANRSWGGLATGDAGWVARAELPLP